MELEKKLLSEAEPKDSIIGMELDDNMSTRAPAKVRRIDLTKPLLLLLFISLLIGQASKINSRTILNFNGYHEVKQIQYIEVEVAPNDTLWTIAKQYSTADPREVVDQIQEVNGVGAVIRPGQRLKVPLGGD